MGGRLRTAALVLGVGLIGVSGACGGGSSEPPSNADEIYEARQKASERAELEENRESALPSLPGGGRPDDPLPTTFVEEVIDGDTVDTGELGRVRLIGVDTPEEGACHDNAATRFTRERLEGQSVGYELDEQREDRYGRTLAYLYRGKMHNLALVEGGYAKVLTIPPNDTYADRFERAERSARSAGDGGWSACDRPTRSGAEAPDRGDGNDQGSAPSAPSGDIDCDQVNGPIPTPPGDPNNLDSNNDGVACE